MPADIRLTDLQFAVMRVLWTRGEATVIDVQDALKPERELANATVATILSRLEQRSVVAHRAEGRQFIYAPCVTEQDVRRSMVAELTHLLFAGDAAALITHLLGSREIEPGDLERVKRMISDEEERSGGENGDPR
jgi:predicted transcriptional regulator